MSPANIITKTATTISESKCSPCGNYRYLLTKKWGNTDNIVAFICENPSVADELRLDPTVANCITLAVNWKFDGIHILNVNPTYSTDPNQLSASDEEKALNNSIIKLIIESVSYVVLAAGQDHKKEIKNIINGFPLEKFYCLKINNDGSFLHPGRISIPDYPEPIPAFTEK